jgi:hypothetical protein
MDGRRRQSYPAGTKPSSVAGTPNSLLADNIFEILDLFSVNPLMQ